MSQIIPSSPASVPIPATSKGTPWYKRWFYGLFAIWTNWRYGAQDEPEALPTCPTNMLTPVEPTILVVPKTETIGEMIAQSLTEHKWKISFSGDSMFMERNKVRIHMYKSAVRGDWSMCGLSINRQDIKLPSAAQDKLERNILKLMRKKLDERNEELRQEVYNELFG